jgi:hypothetical protein
MPQHLSDGVGLAQMVPIVIRITMQHRTNALPKGLAFPLQMSLQLLRCQRVQELVCGPGRIAPHAPHLVQQRRARRSTPPHSLIQTRRYALPLSPQHPVSILLIRQIADDPTDRIHRFEAADGILVRNKRKNRPVVPVYRLGDEF